MISFHIKLSRPDTYLELLFRSFVIVQHATRHRYAKCLMSLREILERLSPGIESFAEDRFDLLEIIQRVEVVAPGDVQVGHESSDSIVVELAVAFIRIRVSVDLESQANELEIRKIASDIYIFDVEFDHAAVLSVSGIIFEGNNALEHNFIQSALAAAFRVRLLNPTNVVVPRSERILTIVIGDCLFQLSKQSGIS